MTTFLHTHFTQPIPMPDGLARRTGAIATCIGLLALLPHAVLAQQTALTPELLAQSLENCLRAEVVKPENASRTVAELRALCTPQPPAAVATSVPARVVAQDGEVLIEDSQSITPNAAMVRAQMEYGDMNDYFFQPYKKNYITFGSLKNEDGSAPFSGESLDIKFELGMQFTLFPEIDSFTALAPLKVGYSQRSWWDIAESSAPFKEHNYNPELFWDFTEALARPSNRTRLHIFDLAGYEHQSNGLDGLRSRSWDRFYVQREFRLSEMLGWSVKAWRVVKLGEHNLDIEDYLGNVEVTTHFEFNNWVGVDVRMLKGHETKKISYQADVILPMSRWVNSRFILSYYEGYGEALVNYNKKSRSVRAGFYFPLGF
jgi:phospholipase A1